MPAVERREVEVSRARLWAVWVIATSAGAGLGSALGSVGHLVAPEAPPLTLAMASFGFGLCQWLVLRHFVRGVGWWVPATVFGALVGLVMTRFDLGVDRFMETTALAGAFVGLCQALVLVRIEQRAVGWIPVSALGWAAAIAVSMYLGQFLEGWSRALNAGMHARGFVFVSMVGYFYGMVTGIPLVIWFGHRRERAEL